MSLLIKICGLRTQEAADAAAGIVDGKEGFPAADLAGFIFHSSSPRAVDVDTAAGIRTYGLRRVGVFVKQHGPEILDIMQRATLHIAQLHGNQDPADMAWLCSRLGREHIIRVIWPERYSSQEGLVAAMKEAAHYAGLLLLDAGSNGGGSGTTLNWNLLQSLADVPPWLLAGGLTPGNVSGAVRQCHPNGVDLNSGLESAPGQKDPQRIRAALSALRDTL